MIDSLGFGNDYRLSASNQLYLPAREYAMVSKAIMAKNAGLADNELKPIDYVYAADEFYIHENHSIGEFSVIRKFDVETEYERIDTLRGLINNGVHGNTDRERLDRLIDDVRRGKGGYPRNNGRSENERYAMANDRISGEQQGSNSVGYSSSAGTDNKVKYSLSSYDTDTEELTPERKKQIFEQFEKDRAEIDKPTQKQLWGERAAWVANNMTRVFSNLPERGERGTFFAEFRKSMIQWNNLPNFIRLK
ncbi:MAG: hypothetical protein ACI4DY_08160 [Monoglobaceae bacterium]